MTNTSRIGRRTFLVLGTSALVGIGSALVMPMLPSEASAGVLTSWSYDENNDLTSEEIAERFQAINETHGKGDSFTDSDVDFTLRYGFAPPSGCVDAKLEIPFFLDRNDTVTGTFTFEGKYLGNFVYQFFGAYDIENNTDEPVHISIEDGFTAYGWMTPFQELTGMCNYSIMHASKDGFDEKIEPGKMWHGEIGADIVGIMGSWYITPEVTLLEI